MSRQATMTKPIMDESPDAVVVSVFSRVREVSAPETVVPTGLKLNQRLKMDGLDFLAQLECDTIPAAFFDPQYRGVLDKLGYGNEGEGRGNARCLLEQMPEDTIRNFVTGIDRALIPSGHLFLWMDKFHLCTGFSQWLDGTKLDVVDMLTWDKCRIGMGYRTRRRSEYLLVLQKHPRKAKGVWRLHNIPDVWQEKVKRGDHTHKKPVGMQGVLIDAVTNRGDTVIDPAAGSFSVFDACQMYGRDFLGCDLNG